MTRKLLKSDLVERYTVSARTIEKWFADPALNFPRPFIINGRPRWHEEEIEAWERSRVASTAPSDDAPRREIGRSGIDDLLELMTDQQTLDESKPGIEESKTRAA